MTIVFKIVLGAFGFVIIAFLIAMALGSISDLLPSASANEDDTYGIMDAVRDNLNEWQGKFEVSGGTTLVCLVTGLLPIPLRFKLPALLIEGLGGAFFWINA